MAGKLRNDLTGKQFDYLYVIRRSLDKGKGKKPVVKWDCLCKCGKVVAVKSDSLLTGHTKSCGCRKIKHGYSHKERLYTTWCNMRRRCSDPTNKRWEQYGGKGVTVCSEWSEYLPFRKWAMKNGYTDFLSIDRINNDGNYEPSNCRWVDSKVQTNNCSRNRIIEYKGKNFTMSELSEHIGLSYSALQHRIDRGWSMDRIVSQPQREVIISK